MFQKSDRIILQHKNNNIFLEGLSKSIHVKERLAYFLSSYNLEKILNSTNENR
jgi:hypothetical protein